MLKARPMSRVFIAASKDQLVPVIEELYRHNLFHIDDFVVDQTREGYEGFRIGMPLPDASQASSDLLKIRSIASTYTVTAESLTTVKKQNAGEFRAIVERDFPAIEKEAESLTSARSGLDNEQKEYEQKIELLRPFASVPVDMELLRGYDTLAVYAGYVSGAITLEIPNEQYFSPSKTGNFIILIVPADQRSVAERALADAMFQMIPIPEESGPAAKAIEN